MGGLRQFSRIIGRATLIRHRCGFLEAEPPFSTHTIIQTCFPDVKVVGADLPNGVVELAEVRPGRRVLYYSKKVEPPEQRVGLVHGLGHFLTDLKGAQGTAECNIGLRELERQGVLPTDPVELEADVFAAEVLVPLDVLDQYAPNVLFPREPALQDAFDDEVDRLASRFNVPRLIIRERLHDLSLMRQTHFWIPG